MRSLRWAELESHLTHLLHVLTKMESTSLMVLLLWFSGVETWCQRFFFSTTSSYCESQNISVFSPLPMFHLPWISFAICLITPVLSLGLICNMLHSLVQCTSFMSSASSANISKADSSPSNIIIYMDQKQRRPQQYALTDPHFLLSLSLKKALNIFFFFSFWNNF